MKSESRRVNSGKNRLLPAARRVLLREIARCLEGIGKLDVRLADECRRVSRDIVAIGERRRRRP